MEKILPDIHTAQNAFAKLLDIEYEFILGRKNKNITLNVEFQKAHFFHIAGLQHLTDLPRLKLSTEAIYNLLENGGISASYIESSRNYDSIKNGLRFYRKWSRFLTATIRFSNIILRYKLSQSLKQIFF